MYYDKTDYCPCCCITGTSRMVEKGENEIDECDKIGSKTLGSNERKNCETVG